MPGKFASLLMLIVLASSTYALFYTDYVAGNPIVLKNLTSQILWGWTYGSYSWAFYVIILAYYIAGVKILLGYYRVTADLSIRHNILLNIAGLIIGVASPLICNTILPQYGNYDWVWLGPTAGIIWVSLIAYSIIRYNQMSVRIVVTEVLVIAMSVAAFINIFIGDFMGIYGKIFVFIAFSVLGAYLIRSSINEAEHREQLADLNKHLQEKVEEQTKEIRASYQVERNSRMELEKIDQTKNQFILITQHHLRTPITSLKWQLESLISGTYGPVSGEVKKAMSDMGESIDRLNHLINGLLSISALRAGIETLKKTSVSLKVIVDQVIAELNKDISRKRLSVQLANSANDWPKLSIDEEKMREVVFIIIENAVRYNIDGGSIYINSNPTEKSFELVVENTGAELSGDDKKKIFSELFYRSSQAQVSHPTGMGIGLSMAQAVIEAHKGTISLGSRKEGGGVKVVMTLPYL